MNYKLRICRVIIIIDTVMAACDEYIIILIDKLNELPTGSYINRV